MKKTPTEPSGLPSTVDLPEGGSPAVRETPPQTAVSNQPESSRPSAAVSPLAMLHAAIERGATIEVLTKLMDLSDRWERAQARKAFDDAIAAAKAEIPPIPKNREGHNNRRYADMAGIAKIVDPIISKYGLSYRFRTTQTDRILVTCVLSHRGGHYEENTLAGPADMSGSKNAIQAIGSALTYLQRYSLVQALGLSSEEIDDDGAAMDKVPTRPIRKFPDLPPPHDKTTGELMNDAIPDYDSPPRTPLAADKAGAPTSAAEPGAPAEDFVEAQQYQIRWRNRIRRAVSTDWEQMGLDWNREKAERNRIRWPDTQTFLELKNEVIKTIAFLKDGGLPL